MNDVLTFLKGLFPASCHERIFLVGGSVRDLLLGREGRDIDLAAALSADELAASGLRLVEGKSTQPIWFGYDKSFGKIEATPLEDAAALAADLARRDFTINAIAMTLAGELIDPLGGKSDLEQRRLRACTPRSFLDDPLRIFRALRFEGEGWRMTPETEALIREQDWSQRLGAIPVERFSREMLKALESPEPERFFQRMLELIVGENYLPEIFRMPRVIAGPPIYHPEVDLFSHSIQVLQRAAQRTGDPLARFCALFHDIGKLATDPALYPSHHGHDEAGFDLARNLCERLRLPAAYRTALAWTSRLHNRLNRWTELRGATRVRMAEQAVKAGIAAILPLVSAADKGVFGEITGWRGAVRVAGMSTAELGIDMERIEAMPGDKRSDFILQRRVEALRAE
ncbi:MAG: HD domain-containing protein [Deltaproteobacteria bacterium]|nr:HD domain-containing protein [Deltaproteobacteria bacterium]